MPKIAIGAKEQAQQDWAALNDRQQATMECFFRAEQRVEEYERGAWNRGDRARPAAEWRWLQFGPVDDGGAAGDGPLQSQLRSLGLLDPGTGATLAALRDRGLIQHRREISGFFPVLWIQVTRRGRAACRAGGISERSSATRAPAGLLTERMWEMLTDLRAAGDGGFKRNVNYLTGWQKLADRGLATIGPKDAGDSLIIITQAGREHYNTNWQKYAALYPGVNAPVPADRLRRWTPQVAAVLTGLRKAHHSIWLQRRTLDKEVNARGPATPEAGLTPEHKAAEALRGKRQKAFGKYHALVQDHHAQLVALHRQALSRYLTTCAAVVDALCNEGDVHAAATRVHEPLVYAESGRPATVPRPKTGLPGVDRQIRLNADAAVKAPRARRARTLPAPEPIDAAIEYAAYLHGLLSGGELERLLLRRAP